MSVDDRDAKNERLYNAIEASLAHMHKKVSPREQMDRLRKRYPSPIFMLESNAFLLAQSGLSRIDAVFFAAIPGITRLCMREEFGKKPRLNTVSAMAGYLKSFFIGVHVECFYLVCLDRVGRLISTVLLQRGTTDSAPFYLKQMLSIAIQRGSKAIVLCHNHPRGTLKPSQEDLLCTLQTLNAISATGVYMLDHIIIAGRRAVSIRQCGFIPAELWTLQGTRSALVRNWLDKDLL